jgi:hypothetical protein
LLGEGETHASAFNRRRYLLAFGANEQGNALWRDGHGFVHDLQLLPRGVDGGLGVAGDADESVGSNVDFGDSCGRTTNV